MHELSIATSIVAMAVEESERRGAKVLAVHLKLGLLSGVVQDALLFSWDLACDETPLEGARLVIEESPVVIRCPRCREPRTLASIQWFACPDCNTPTSDVLSGDELEVVALEIAS